MQLRELTAEEFQLFVKQYHDHSVYQSSPYAYVMNQQNFETMFLGLFDQNKIVAATLVLIQKYQGFNRAYAPRGFLVDYKNEELLYIFTEEIKKFLGKREIISVRLCPMIIKEIKNKDFEPIENNEAYSDTFNRLTRLGYRHLGYNNQFEALKPRFDAVLDLTPSYVSLFEQIDKSYRTKIRTAEKNGIRIYRGTMDHLEYLYLQTKQKYPRDLTYFKDCYHYFSKYQMIEFYYAKLDTEVFLKITKERYEKQIEISEQLNEEIIRKASSNPQKLINRKINSDQLADKLRKQLIYATTLLRDQPGGIVLASALTIKNNGEIFLMMDGYDRTYRNFNAKHLLFWKLIEKYSKANYQTFNFGGITNVLNTLPKYQGLNTFRLSFGSHVLEYAGDFELITNQKLYFMAKQAATLKSILQK